MERPSLCAIALMAWAHLCWACDVDQSPSLLVASKEHSTISCKVTTVPDQYITTSVFLKDEPKVQLNERYILTDTTTPTIIQHSFPTTKSGTYICRVTCGNKTNKTGKGTYIYVRDSGYEEPIGPAGTLQRGMIALLVLLLLLSASGTYLVLPFHRKKQGKPSKSSGAPAVTPQPTTLQPEEETCGSLYTSLQPHSDDVYDILDEEIPGKTSVELHAEVHGVLSHSPMKRPKPQAKSTPIHEKPQPVPNKPPIKQKPKKAVADNSLYENLKR